MKKTVKTILASALALMMLASLGSCAFAEYGFWTPNGYCVDHENGQVTMYYNDGSTETVNNNIGSRTYGDTDGSSLTVYRDGDSLYQNRYGYGNYASVNVGNSIYHYNAFGTLIGVQVFNGSWYETVWGI